MSFDLYHTCYMAFRACGAAWGGPPASLTGLVTGDNTGAMLGHVFGHHASRMRVLEAAASRLLDLKPEQEKNTRVEAGYDDWFCSPGGQLVNFALRSP